VKLWSISSSNIIDKKLKKFKSDASIINGYKRAILDLVSSDDPRTIGKIKHGKYKYCYAFNVTKSHRLLYRVLFEENVVQLIDLDDHKTLFGRDNRS